MPDPGRDQTVQAQTVHAQTVLAEVLDEWMARRGVISLEVARRWQSGRPTDGVAIRVTLERKLPADEVAEGELFPKSLHGVEINVVEGRRPTLER